MKHDCSDSSRSCAAATVSSPSKTGELLRL
jgi:hypothetical protein